VGQNGEMPAPDFLVLPPRPPKPRQCGLTQVIDRGLPLVTLTSLLDLAGAHIDFLKFGWGTAYVSQQMAEKVAACRRAGVRACTGGTLLEIASLQGKVAEFARWARSLGLDTVEVSEGTLDLAREVKRELIASLADDFCVVAEVGSKDPRHPVRPDEWVEHMVDDLQAGASYVVAEGRESGTVGLYEPGGEVRQPLVEAICSAVPLDRIIFEAPTRTQQTWFIRRLGPDVNLGNISPDDILSVETLRRGLRTDTVDLACPVLDGPR
jgi:phosphosulfolactate synthase